MFTIIVKTNAGSDLQPRFQETELTARTAAELAVQSAQLLAAAANPASPQFVASQRARASLTNCLQLAPPRPAPALGCPRIFDSLVCFNWTAAGEVAQSACPAGHPTLGNPAGFVNKQCQEDGQWQREPFTNLTWSNYSNCIFGLEDNGSFDTVGKIEYHPTIEDSFALVSKLYTIVGHDDAQCGRILRLYFLSPHLPPHLLPVPQSQLRQSHDAQEPFPCTHPQQRLLALLPRAVQKICIVGSRPHIF